MTSSDRKTSLLRLKGFLQTRNHPYDMLQGVVIARQAHESHPGLYDEAKHGFDNYESTDARTTEDIFWLPLSHILNNYHKENAVILYWIALELGDDG